MVLRAFSSTELLIKFTLINSKELRRRSYIFDSKYTTIIVKTDTCKECDQWMTSIREELKNQVLVGKNMAKVRGF